MNAVEQAVDLSLVSGNYHEQKEPSGVNLASAEAKIHDDVANKVSEKLGTSLPRIMIQLSGVHVLRNQLCSQSYKDLFARKIVSKQHICSHYPHTRVRKQIRIEIYTLNHE